MSSRITKVSKAYKHNVAKRHNMGIADEYNFVYKESDIFRIIRPPKYFTVKYAGEFLKDIEYIFTDCEKTHLILDLESIIKVDLVGQTLIYQFLSYTKKHECALRKFYVENKDQNVQKQFLQTGFYFFIESMFSNPRNNTADNFKSIIKDQLFIYPRILNRESKSRKIAADAELLSLVNRFYSTNNNKKAINVVSRIISEISSNFIEHAIEDSETLLSARGTPDQFKLVIADNAKGIVQTLKPFYNDLENQEILLKSIEKGVSSKKDKLHMGYGLYLISNLCQKNNGQLNIWSNGAHLYNDKKNRFLCNSAGYWKGSLVSIVVNLNNPISVESFDEYKEFDNYLQLQFG